MYIDKRDIVKCILLSFITCGIYGIIWFVKLTDDAANASGDNSMSGLKALLLGIVTCGIYYYYWAYKMGKNLQAAKIKHGMSSDDSSVLYLILQLFGLGIVNYCLMQNELNSIADKGGFNEQQNVQPPVNTNNVQ